MEIVCLDLEGVLVPEIWIAFAEETGIPELKRTTRDEPDYDFKMRCEKSKYTTVKALQSIGYDTIASGDSHNDLGMIQASKAGFLFKSTDAIKSEYPEIPAYETYDELYNAIKEVIEG